MNIHLSKNYFFVTVFAFLHAFFQKHKTFIIIFLVATTQIIAFLLLESSSDHFLLIHPMLDTWLSYVWICRVYFCGTVNLPSSVWLPGLIALSLLSFYTFSPSDKKSLKLARVKLLFQLHDHIVVTRSFGG